MKLNSDKCLLLVSGYHYEEMFINIGNKRILESKNVELLRITINKDLKFDKHVNKKCSQAKRKLNVLSRMRNFLSAGKRRMIFKSFIESQFKHSPLTWMSCIRRSNNKMNNLRKRSWRIVNNDYESTYDELLSHKVNLSIISIKVGK